MKLVTLTPAVSIFALILCGCSASKTIPGADRVELVNEAPDRSKCEFLGEVVGSQGNWFTGDVTSNENLVVGARNELRNEAYRLGANVVHVQDLKNSSAYGSMGTTNTTGIGKAYRCKN
ncbi:DUF4156 domain-containing protein [Simiduia sp. 21SJ11W-1]|uniref:DUF4156 domain-containing protein n=1 Tax=Simiduia sp. 21SJ11W-1 TaxID=2909669 RepID=UPI0020A0FBBF|nr:DUF4156 domain-containing protein [Simiduia sp. 21SJ11W-1]UTA46423.1 DUF4156 domain-containing protein [Simiduia sp. 21SJ11W-1]UTA46804.1 DUF4156 domain-containing protein [Simiduia sp. 21SJ11W-1]